MSSKRRHTSEKPSTNSSKKLKTGSAPLASQLNNEEKNTLEKMHTRIVQTKHQDPTQAVNNTSFNNKTMTKLTKENLDTKPLRESRISNKIYKPPVVNKTDKSEAKAAAPKNGMQTNGDGEMNEMSIRRELGDDVVNTIDNYLSMENETKCSSFCY